MNKFWIIIFVIFLVLPNLTSCAQLAYYSQSIKGQWEINVKKRPIRQILEDETTSEILHRKLTQASKIRQFAIDYLYLPNNESYLTYADLDREFVVWNVFATPELSLEPVQSCFLIVGCLSYQGYFEKKAALKQANLLRENGYDVYVGGVSAYSTLGWFNDPVLNTMLTRDITYLAKIIFHELAHQKIYIKNDTDFNEAFAETIALKGIEQWLLRDQLQNDLEKFISEKKRENEFVELVLQTRNKLETIYKSEFSDQIKSRRKTEIIEEMREKYKELRAIWKNNDYDNWFDTDINNAKIAAVATYRDLIPNFMHFLERSENDFAKFYEIINKLKSCSFEKRRAILEKGSIQFNC